MAKNQKLKMNSCVRLPYMTTSRMSCTRRLMRMVLILRQRLVTWNHKASLLYIASSKTMPTKPSRSVRKWTWKSDSDFSKPGKRMSTKNQSFSLSLSFRRSWRVPRSSLLTSWNLTKRHSWHQSRRQKKIQKPNRYSSGMSNRFAIGTILKTPHIFQEKKQKK